MESRFIHAAVSGITSDRNTVISNKKDRMTTMATKSGSLALNTLAKSM